MAAAHGKMLAASCRTSQRSLAGLWVKEPSVPICSSLLKLHLSILCSSLAQSHFYTCPVSPSQCGSPGQNVAHTDTCLMWQHPFLPACSLGRAAPTCRLVSAPFHRPLICLAGLLQHCIHYETSRHHSLFAWRYPHQQGPSILVPYRSHLCHAPNHSRTALQLFQQSLFFSASFT